MFRGCNTSGIQSSSLERTAEKPNVMAGYSISMSIWLVLVSTSSASFKHAVMCSPTIDVSLSSCRKYSSFGSVFSATLNFGVERNSDSLMDRWFIRTICLIFARALP